VTKARHSEDHPLIHYWTSQPGAIVLPSEQTDIKRRWRAIVMVCDNNEVTEYSVAPTSRTTLSQMLGIIQDNIRHLSTDQTNDCGFKIW
jgi:hypothetical protein